MAVMNLPLHITTDQRGITRRLPLVILIVTVLGLFACASLRLYQLHHTKATTTASSNTPTTTDTTLPNGIEGHAVLSPSTPTCAAGDSLQASDCTSPYQQSYSFIVTNNTTDKLVATVTTDSKGTFKHSLPAGSYTLETTAPEGLTALPQTVKVEANKFTEVTIAFDSGLR